jgi:glycosyltransferase involved in cell wall biosynthesis
MQGGGGLFFSNYFEFEETVNFLLDHETSRRRMGQLGYQYVRDHYSWEKVLNRFEDAFGDYLKSLSL